MARRKTKQERQLDELLRKFEPQVRAAFIAAIQAQRQAIDVSDLIAALEEGNIEKAVNLFRANQQLLFPLTEAVRASYLAGSTVAASALPIKVRASFGFGGNPRAVEAIERITTKLAGILEAEKLDMAREVFTRGVAEGVPPRKQALDMVGRVPKGGRVRSGGFIGLDSQRAGQAQRVQAILSDPERISEYFNGSKPRFTSTDRRFDKKVRAAIKAGKALSPADLSKVTRLHKTRLLKQRGETIARTETLNALRTGQHDGFGTMVDDGLVAADDLTKEWLTQRDGRERDAHAALGGTVLGFKELFQSPTGGALAHAGDTANGAGAADLVQCRCATVYRIKRKGK